VGQPGYGRRLPQPGQLTIGEELLGYHNNNNQIVYITLHYTTRPLEDDVVELQTVRSTRWNLVGVRNRQHDLCTVSPAHRDNFRLLQTPTHNSTTAADVY